ncbi:MAG: hypothetical protein RL230_945, partial [Pseudomonadota bacterium]
DGETLSTPSALPPIAQFVQDRVDQSARFDCAEDWGL